MIHDFNAGAEGWTDWNILLDEHGGPNHVGNDCFAPIHADTRSGNLFYGDAYYYLGHFSKFVRPGARRIANSSSTDALLTTAFRNESGRLVVEVMNATNASIPFLLWLGSRSAPAKSPPHSILTAIVGESDQD
jgi:glucosylceramidase